MFRIKKDSDRKVIEQIRRIMKDFFDDPLNDDKSFLFCKILTRIKPMVYSRIKEMSPENRSAEYFYEQLENIFEEIDIKKLLHGIESFDDILSELRDMAFEQADKAHKESNQYAYGRMKCINCLIGYIGELTPKNHLERKPL